MPRSYKRKGAKPVKRTGRLTKYAFGKARKAGHQSNRKRKR